MARDLAGTADPTAQSRWAASLLARGEVYFLSMALAIGFVSHAYNMFRYPQYLGDEGIYMEQAWAVLREFRLAPYTYWYDHAPAGWLLIAGWVFLLPGKFLTLGMAINTGRVFMLVLHLGSIFLLYRIVRHWTGSDPAALLASILFSLSPLALYYQRMVLLDNIMVFWLLLALYWLLCDEGRLWTIMGSAAALGVAALTKENAVFFIPVLAYLLYVNVRRSHRFRFAVIGWGFTVALIVSLYPLYALLKHELFPPPGAVLGGDPRESISLVGTVLWQMGRGGGSILDPGSQFWRFFWTAWWDKDAVIIVLGAAATVANLALGLRDRRRNRPELVASLLAVSFFIYLARGSVILEFYLVPLLPLMAINAALLMERLTGRFPLPLSTGAYAVLALTLSALFIRGADDHYRLDLTGLQAQQLAWVRENVDPDAKLVIDDDLWVDLHEGKPAFPNAHSHWKVASDPEIRDGVFDNDWREIDYLVMSDDLLDVFQNNNEDLALTAYENSDVVAEFREGDVLVQVRRVNP